MAGFTIKISKIFVNWFYIFFNMLMIFSVDK
jgi:hypothetical protein